MSQGSSTARAAWAISGVIFAATMMVLVGAWQLGIGIAAIVEDEFFVVAPNYAYELDTTAWGWIHVGLGALTLLVGFALFSGATWARVTGILLAILVAINNFLFLPYYPLWSIVVIALAVFVIWALAAAPAMDREAADRPRHGYSPDPR